MKQFLKFKHWQLFTLLFAIPFVFQMIMMATVMKSNDPGIFISSFPFLLIYVLGLFFSWFYAMGVNLHQRLPKTVTMHLKKLKLFLFAPLVYMLFLFGFMFVASSDLNPESHPAPAFFAWFIPLHFFSVFCIFYCLYFIAKALKAVELQRPVEFNEYAGEFIMIWFFPIGVWFIQPRINRLFGCNNH